ncbi:MAG TPA: hypothetical protein VFB12_30710 [Ktedonobacteraceae bacterium]|nr:hypothetical protein [Ktedonobacteraceae bacterium]
MKKRIVAFLCLSVMVSLLVLGVLFSHPDGTPSPEGTRVTLVTPSGDREYAPPSPGSESW